MAKNKASVGSDYRIEDRDGQLVLAGPNGRVVHTIFPSKIDVTYEPGNLVNVRVEFYAGEPEITRKDAMLTEREKDNE